MKVLYLLLLTIYFLLPPAQAQAAIHLGQPNMVSLTNGLVGYWTFDGPVTNWNTNTTVDLSGNGNTGQLVNMSTTTSPTPGKIGQALKFDGTTSYTEMSSATTFNNTIFTVCAWTRTNISDSRDQFIIGNRYTTNIWQLEQYNAPPQFEFYTYTSGTQPDVFSDPVTNWTVGSWSQVCAVQDATQAILYVNGVQSGAPSPYTGTLSNTTGVRVGWGNLADRFFSGSIDDVRYYNRALSATEVQQLYHLGAANAAHSNVGISDGLVGYWTMDGGSIDWSKNQMTDMSGHGNTGQLINMSTSSSPVAGKIGQALRFNNSSSRVDISGSQIAENSAFTISAWFNTTDPSNGTNDNIYCEASSNDANWVCIWLANGALEAGIEGSLGSAIITQSTSVRDGHWHQVIFAQTKGNSRKLYLDGNEIGSDSTDDGSLSLDFATIGVYRGSALGDFFGGQIDDVRTYNRALSAQEVQQLYSLGAANIAHSNAVISDGLVGYWTFDGPSIDWRKNQAADMSGNGNTGTLVNMSTSTSPTPGKIGQTLTFNGTDNFIEIPDANSLKPAEVTVAAWVNPATSTAATTCGTNSDPASQLQYLLFKRNTRTDQFEGYSLWTYPAGNQFYYYFNVRSSGGINGIAGTGPYRINQWHHLVGVFKQPYVSLYADGVLVDKELHDYPLDYGTYDVFLGRSGECGAAGHGNFDGYFTGKIDDVRIYDRALSAQEVQQLYKAGR